MDRLAAEAVGFTLALAATAILTLTVTTHFL
jgi:hypothetical protein